MAAKCMNCASEFLEQAKGIRRYSVEKTINQVPLYKVLKKHLSLDPVTPLSKSKSPLAERCLCHVCFNIVQKIERGETAIEK